MLRSVRITFLVLIAAMAAAWLQLRHHNTLLEARVEGAAR